MFYFKPGVRLPIRIYFSARFDALLRRLRLFIGLFYMPMPVYAHDGERCDVDCSRPRGDKLYRWYRHFSRHLRSRLSPRHRHRRHQRFQARRDAHVDVVKKTF